MKCEYGCEQEAKHVMKNGKGCCSKSPNSCPERRRLDSERKKGKIPNWKNGHPHGMLGKNPWNKGKITSDEQKKKISDALKNNPKVNGKANTVDKENLRRKAISDTMKNNPNAGGYRKGSGRGKKGWYKGFWCDSSWELAFVIYNLEHDISFERNNERFEYCFNGKHKYIPDFILQDGTYIEIKGRRSYVDLDEKNKAKISSFSGKLKVLYEKDMKHYLEYVIGKYGKGFVKLYKSEE